MAIRSLEEKFVHELGDIYDAEHRCREAQQAMRKQASGKALKCMLEHQIEEKEEQIENRDHV